MSTQGLPVVSFFIADKTGIRRALAQHHLDVLLDGQFVARTQGKDAPVWAIDKKGRAYLAERGQL